MDLDTDLLIFDKGITTKFTKDTNEQQEKLKKQLKKDIVNDYYTYVFFNNKFVNTEQEYNEIIVIDGSNDDERKRKEKSV